MYMYIIACVHFQCSLCSCLLTTNKSKSGGILDTAYCSLTSKFSNVLRGFDSISNICKHARVKKTLLDQGDQKHFLQIVANSVNCADK